MMNPFDPALEREPQPEADFQSLMKIETNSAGAWTPPEAMPAGMHEAMFLSPLYYFIEMGYGILLKGAGLDVLWDSLLGLALLGMVIFGFGVWRFKRQFG
ncbi:MAG: ABC transporter permease [Pseudomonadota bacterium]|jgi:ABC-2 type transport system permease protein